MASRCCGDRDDQLGTCGTQALADVRGDDIRDRAAELLDQLLAAGTPPMTARRSRRVRSNGYCPLCRRPIKAADKVVRSNGKGWVHAGCQSARNVPASKGGAAQEGTT